MALAKFYEDIIDDYTDKNSFGYTPIVLPKTPTEFNTKKYIACIYHFCELVFNDYDELLKHILNDHGINCYVRIDDIIADDITVYKSIPQKIEITNSSLVDTFSVMINFDNKQISNKILKPRSTFSLSRKQIMTGRYEVIFSDIQKKYIIYLNQLPEFDSKGLDPLLNNYVNEYQVLKKIASNDDDRWTKFGEIF